VGVLFQERIGRAAIRKTPERLYVSGENLERNGFGRQARECRGELNAIGVPAKLALSVHRSAFFSDADYDQHESPIHRAVTLSPLRRKPKPPVVEGRLVMDPTKRDKQQNIKVSEDCPAAFETFAKAACPGRVTLFEDLADKRLEALLCRGRELRGSGV
jgi:hypothetical protein